VKRILLIGAGHAHLAVLRNLAKKPLYGSRITLVTPQEKQIYSGMLPGLVAGHYRLDDVRIDVARFAAGVHVEFVQGAVVTLDLAEHVAKLRDGAELPYDFVSLNVGAAVDAPFDGSQHAVGVRPYETFLARLSEERLARVAIAGAGATGMELAMALRFRGAAVTLFSDRPAMSPQLATRAVAALRRAGVDFRPGMAVTAVEPGPVVIAGTSHQEFDLLVLATGPRGIAWLRGCGLETDGRGFVLVDAALRSVSHPDVLAVGDCAKQAGADEAKSGVASVRQARVLEENLRRIATRDEPRPYERRPRALQLISCGAKYAIAERGNWTAEGAWVWRWKDWIDRRWVRSFQ